MKKYVCVLQDGMKDCGVCSLQTIIKHYNGYVSREYLRMITNTTTEGVTAFSLLEAGRKLGFDTKGVNGDVFDIDDKFLPCIAHVIIDDKFKHFVVIYKINRKRNYIVIADPSKGILKMTKEQFLKISTNNYLFLIPNKKIPYIKNENYFKRTILDFVYKNKNIFIVIIGISVLYTLLNILVSFNFKFIIDRSLAFSSKSNLYFLFFIMLFIYILKDIAEYFRNRLLNFINHKLDCSLISNAYFHILSLPHLYYKNRTSGEIIARINDLSEIRDYISHIIITFLVDAILLVFVIITLFFISIKLTFIILLFIVIYIFITCISDRILEKSTKIIKENEGQVRSYMLETINGIDSIRSLNSLNFINDKYSLLYNKYLSSSYNFSIIANTQKLSNDVIISIMILIVILLGGIMVIEGEISLADLITFNSLIYYFLESIKNVISFNYIVRKSKIIIDRINEILAIKKENVYADSSKIIMSNGNIKIDKLSYSYNNKTFLFNNLSLFIKRKEKIVIYGSSGSGKSTLGKIIARYIPVDRNKVFINGTDINDFNLYSVRENITYVSQNETLFTDSIYNNINLRETRDNKKILKICNCTLVNEVVSDKPMGYNMVLEENGSNLSGGERQRIILARAFLKESSIYILDESFSEIDIKSERKILKNLFKNYSDKTIIVITHRLDNNFLYDRVINIEDFKYANKWISRKFL